LSNHAAGYPGRFLAAILVSLGKAVNTFIFFHFSDSGLNLLNGVNISFIFDNMRVKTSKILSTQMISEISMLKIKNAGTVPASCLQ